MNDIFKSFSSMMEGNKIPDNIKEMLNSFQKENVNNSNTNSNENSSEMPNIDINTIMKMQSIMSAMNDSSNNSGVTLLRSLKPYLKPSRQSKVDEYIQLFNIEKVISLMNKSGGDKKNDS